MIYYKSKIGEVRTKEQWIEWAEKSSYRLRKNPNTWHKVVKLLELTAVWVKDPSNIDSTTLQPVWQEVQDTPDDFIRFYGKKYSSEENSYEQYPEHSACMKRVGWEEK